MYYVYNCHEIERYHHLQYWQDRRLVSLMVHCLSSLHLYFLSLPVWVARRKNAWNKGKTVVLQCIIFYKDNITMYYLLSLLISDHCNVNIKIKRLSIPFSQSDSPNGSILKSLDIMHIIIYLLSRFCKNLNKYTLRFLINNFYLKTA